MVDIVDAAEAEATPGRECRVEDKAAKTAAAAVGPASETDAAPAGPAVPTAPDASCEPCRIGSRSCKRKPIEVGQL